MTSPTPETAGQAGVPPKPALKRLRGARSRGIQRNALGVALAIAEDRAAVCRRTEEDWAACHPDDKLGQATERSARMEAELIAERIRALMT